MGKLKIRQKNGKDYVLCAWRRRFVRLTPEEYVRQTFLHCLVEEYGYPMGLVAVEVPLEGKRADAIVYDRQMQAQLLIEFKAENVPLTQQTLDQAATYNRQVKVPWLILHNGKSSLIAHVEENNITFLDHIPNYGELI